VQVNVRQQFASPTLRGNEINAFMTKLVVPKVEGKSLNAVFAGFAVPGAFDHNFDLWLELCEFSADFSDFLAIRFTSEADSFLIEERMKVYLFVEVLCALER
jgi:hypothetical protein